METDRGSSELWGVVDGGGEVSAERPTRVRRVLIRSGEGKGGGGEAGKWTGEEGELTLDGLVRALRL